MAYFKPNPKLTFLDAEFRKRRRKSKAQLLSGKVIEYDGCSTDASAMNRFYLEMGWKFVGKGYLIDENETAPKNGALHGLWRRK